MCVSKPKVPKAPEVIERQPYKMPAPRNSVDTGDPSKRSRQMSGIVNPGGAQGDTSVASTTANPIGAQTLGGGPPLPLGGGTSTSTAAPIIASPTAAPPATTASSTSRPRGFVYTGRNRTGGGGGTRSYAALL